MPAAATAPENYNPGSGLTIRTAPYPPVAQPHRLIAVAATTVRGCYPADARPLNALDKLNVCGHFVEDFAET